MADPESRVGQRPAMKPSGLDGRLVERAHLREIAVRPRANYIPHQASVMRSRARSRTVLAWPALGDSILRGAGFR